MLITERKTAEKRTAKRRHLLYYLEAVDSVENVVVGYVYDVTSKGMMLVCGQEMPVGKTVSFRVRLPQGLSSSESFSVTAQCCWSSIDHDPQKYVAGFEFTQIERPSVVAINTLISRFGFSDR